MKEEVVNVGELISGIVATHEMFVSDSGLTLEYNAQPDVMVVGDNMIRQATGISTPCATSPAATLPCR